MKNINPILLVEDDKVDAMTVQRALKDLMVENRMIHRVNGEDALAYLREPEEAFPCVILLDLNMPRMNGIEFLEVAKQDEALRHIPVVVLTTSKKACDIVDSFRLSVAGYIVKPVDYQNFVAAIRALDLYWTLSVLPEPEGEDKHENRKTATIS